MKSVHLYEKFMFGKYEKDCMHHHAEWKFHYQQLQEIFEVALSRNQRKNIKIGLIGCGICPCGRDLPVDFIQKYILSDKVDCIVLCDISERILKTAEDNLSENGLSKDRIDSRKIDLTFGEAEIIGNMILDAISLNNEEAILSSLEEILPLRIETIKQKCDANLDFIYCPMTLLATLNPFVSKAFKKLQNSTNSFQSYERIEFEIERIWQQHNEKTVMNFFNIFKNINNFQEWLIVTEISENRFNGTRKERTSRQLEELIEEIATPIFFSVEKPWMWMDSDDHYHEVHSIHFRC